MNNNTVKVILDRVSCKSYSNKKVSTSKIQKIAECGKNAPSGMNRQICNITVVNTKRNVEKLRELSKEILNRDCFYNAQTMVLVHAPREDKFCITDCSCILENMFIAATALKLGSCWINQVDDLFNTLLLAGYCPFGKRTNSFIKRAGIYGSRRSNGLLHRKKNIQAPST